MTSKEFIVSSARTDDDNIAKIRLNQSQVFNTLVTAKDNMIFTNDVLDGIKKYIFYGRNFADFGIQQRSLFTLEDIPFTDKQISLLHTGLGLLTEAFEFLEPVVKSLQTGDDIDDVNMKEELGDSLWYIAKAMRTLNTDFETEFKRNQDKLRARYPEKFNSEQAINRDLDNEYKVLQGEVK